MTEKGKPARHWCFTYNNYRDEDLSNFVCNLPTRYICYSHEKGTVTGTPHLQGYIEFVRPVRITFIKKLLKCPGLHLECRRGTREQARDYCRKEEGAIFFEDGDWEAGGQGTRNDLREAMSMVKADKPKLEIMEELPEVFARNQKFLETYRCELDKSQTKEFRHVSVEVIHGDPGTGKTRSVWEREEKVFTVNAEDAFPFDGYDGEQAILFDDFYGSIKQHTMLRLLDGYQLRVNVKGSHRYAKWTRVYITSNKRPEDWYQAGLSEALKRRITNVTELLVTK